MPPHDFFTLFLIKSVLKQGMTSLAFSGEQCTVWWHQILSLWRRGRVVAHPVPLVPGGGLLPLPHPWLLQAMGRLSSTLRSSGGGHAYLEFDTMGRSGFCLQDPPKGRGDYLAFEGTGMLPFPSALLPYPWYATEDGSNSMYCTLWHQALLYILEGF